MGMPVSMLTRRTVGDSCWDWKSAGEHADPAHGGGFVLGLEVGSHQSDRLPVPDRHLDPDLRGQLLGKLRVPFLGVGEESLSVDVDLAIPDGGGRHFVTSLSWLWVFDSDVGLRAGSGIGRPGSSTCQ